MFDIIVSLNSFEYIYITKNFIFLKKILNFIYSQKTKNTFQKITKYKKNVYKKNFVYKKKFLRKNFFVKNYGIIKKQKLFTVNTSPHIDKKSREQFFLNIYKKKLYIYNLNIKQVILFLFLVKNSNLYGIQLKICYFLKTFYSK